MKFTLTLLILLFINIGWAKSDILPFKIYDKNGKSINFQKVVKQVSAKSYVFFGELHNNTIAHWLQLELTQHLYQKHKKKLLLGGEMFEADNQFILDEYLNGYISSRNYQKEMRLWPNYNTDYKPLVEFAKKNNLKFVATNIPRRYANMVYKKGVESLKKLTDLAKSYIAPISNFSFDSTVACYKDMINMPHGGIKMAQAQAIKDATMAHFIFKNSNPQSCFLHFNGSYHSNNNEGIIHYLKQKVSLDKIATITTVTQDDINKLEKDNMGTADFIICVKSTVTSTH